MQEEAEHLQGPRQRARLTSLGTEVILPINTTLGNQEPGLDSAAVKNELKQSCSVTAGTLLSSSVKMMSAHCTEVPSQFKFRLLIQDWNEHNPK